MSIKDVNNIPKVKKRIKDFKSRVIDVGLIGDEELAMIGAVHEFGTTINPKKAKFLAIPAHKTTRGRSPRDFKNLKFRMSKDGQSGVILNDKGALYFILVKQVKIPERSYIRSTFDNRRKVDKIIKLAQQLWELKKPTQKVLNQVGLLAASLIQGTMRSNIPPPNVELTVRMKGGKTKTLVGTGRMIKGVTYKIK